MDSFSCSLIGSAAGAAVSVIRGCCGLAAPSALRFPIGCHWDGFVEGNLLPSGARLAGIPFVFPVGRSYRGWCKYAFSFTFVPCGGGYANGVLTMIEG